MVVCSDIIIFSVAITSVISVEQLVFGVSGGADQVHVSLHMFENPLVPLFFVSVGPYVEVFSESSHFVVRTENVVVGVRERPDDEHVAVYSVENQLVSFFVVGVGSHVEVRFVIPVVVV